MAEPGVDRSEVESARALLRRMFDAAVDAAQPARAVPLHLPAPPRGRTIVVGAGKASAAMAQALEGAWPAPLEGVVVTRYGHAVPCRHIEVLGTLPDHFTGTGYRVTPVVGLVHPPFELQADPFEVEEIFEVPLAFLMDGMNHQVRSIDLPGAGGRRSFYTMPYGRFFIWGATAAMLRNLFHFMRA